MMNVFYCFILNIIGVRYGIGEQQNLVVNEHFSIWKDAFPFCKNRTYWQQLLRDCQPESCNVNSIADSIVDMPKLWEQQYWIYGYVLRSPVIVNIGCVSLIANFRNTFHQSNFSFLHNSAYECSRACENNSVKYMFLKGSECLCITDHRFSEEMTNSYTTVNIDACNISCIGNHGDICGGDSSTNGKVLYSVYKIINRTESDGMQFGSTCSAIQFDESMKKSKSKYTKCSSTLNYICEGYNKTNGIYPKECNTDRVSWYTAQQNCKEKGMQLTSYLPDTKCLQKRDLFWVGNHADENIQWGENRHLPDDALCLKIVIKGSEIRLETEKCRSRLGSLCYTFNISSGDKGTTNPYSSTISAVENSSTVPIVAGSVGGILGIVIILVILIVIKRRKNQNHKPMNTTVDQRQPHSYSEPIKNTIQEDSRKLVNVTEEGIYNHLGDSEKMIEMKPQDSSIYDVTGDDEYHVFTGSGKQTIKHDDDLYDHGAASEVYNTLNDTVTTNRPESDTYNVK